jgi:hypothetical protein
LRQEPDGSLVAHADLASLGEHPWNDIVVDGMTVNEWGGADDMGGVRKGQVLAVEADVPGIGWP